METDLISMRWNYFKFLLYLLLLLSNSCIVIGNSMYITLLGPVAAILLANFTMFSIILRSLTTRKIKMAASTKSKDGRQESMEELKRHVRSAFTIATLLGLSWVFALFAVGEAREVFQWVFSVLNSLQGFFVFVLYTVRNPEVRKQLVQTFNCAAQNPNTFSTSSSSAAVSSEMMHLNRKTKINNNNNNATTTISKESEHI